jgi:hypothetical protein
MSMARIVTGTSRYIAEYRAFIDDVNRAVEAGEVGPPKRWEFARERLDAGLLAAEEVGDWLSRYCFSLLNEVLPVRWSHLQLSCRDDDPPHAGCHLLTEEAWLPIRYGSVEPLGSLELQHPGKAFAASDWRRYADLMALFEKHTHALRCPSVGALQSSTNLDLVTLTCSHPSHPTPSAVRGVRFRATVEWAGFYTSTERVVAAMWLPLGGR